MRIPAIVRPAAVLSVTLFSLAARPVPQPAAPGSRALTPANLADTWAATLEHAGETRQLGLTLNAVDDKTVGVKLSNPALHVDEVPIGSATIDGDAISLGPDFSLRYDTTADTLTCVLPDGLVPLYKITAVFHRGHVAPEPRRAMDGPAVSPVWTLDLRAPIWADVAYGKGLVFAGADDGRLHAIDPSTGQERWTFAAGGPIRSRATLDGDALFIQADGGMLYRLDAHGGSVRWKVRVSEKPVQRLPPTDPKSRFNRFASAVTVRGNRLYLGTDDGHVLALDPDTGARIWSVAAGDSVNSTPTLDGERLYFGSFDRHVYAVDAKTGTLLWKHDTGGPVVSTPAVHQGHVIVGSRSYDLLALDGQTGAPIWTRYIWFSWIESSAVIRDDTVFVGSSDAAKLYAFDAATGRTTWDLDVMGWAWGQPAVTDSRVFIGTAGAAKYPVTHQPAVLAVDRTTGHVAWRYQAETPVSGTYGFPASPALAGTLVVIGGVDGKVYAFTQ